MKRVLLYEWQLKFCEIYPVSDKTVESIDYQRGTLRALVCLVVILYKIEIYLRNTVIAAFSFFHFLGPFHFYINSLSLLRIMTLKLFLETFKNAKKSNLFHFIDLKAFPCFTSFQF